MWIRLLRPYAVTFPSRTEPVGSVVSIGNPRGCKLVAAGIAEPSEPLDPEQDDIERLREKARRRQRGKSLWDDPKAARSQLVQVQSSRAEKRAAVVAMLIAASTASRRSTKRRRK